MLNFDIDNFDSIVAGAGIWGCTIARRLAEAGHKVLVLERRAVIGGNVHCEIDEETGIEIHTYGSHIFHTHNQHTWEFVRRFTEFNGYQHKVLANYMGKIYHLPLGLTLINKFFSVELKPGDVESFLGQPVTHSAGERVGGKIAQCLRTNRDVLFEAFFRGYTCKQWGLTLEAIDPAVIKRLPVRNNYDTNYFKDYWQGIPSEGYNKLFERLLNHQNITVRCNMPFSLNQRIGQSVRQKIYYSGPIDSLFGYKFGPLPWRSLRFEIERLPCADYQGTAVMNYTEIGVPFTRIHEFKHYHPNRRFGSLLDSANAACRTVIMREYPQKWKLGDEPYYPINNPESDALLSQYRGELVRYNQSVNHSIVIGGRLGNYEYYDMDQAMQAALELEI